MKLTQVEIPFYNPRSENIVMIQQACTCHPFDIIKTWGKRWTQSSSMSFRSKYLRNKYLKRYVQL